MRAILLSLAVGYLLFPPSLFGQGIVDRDELEVDHGLTLEVVTPHTDWAQPYARGKTRVLFFTLGVTDYGGTRSAPRECVELMQRFDVEAEAVFWTPVWQRPDVLHGSTIGLKRMNDLLKKKWDCFVFFHKTPKDLPAEEQYLLIKQVADGAGLVLVGANDERMLKEKLRIANTPPFLASNPVGDAYRIGQGRGVRMPNPPVLDYHEGWETEYDYLVERLGRAILWAAGKEPRVQVKLVAAKPAFLCSEPKRVTARLSGSPVGGKFRIQLTVRRPADQPLVFPEKEIQPGVALDFMLPEVFPADEYHADAKIVSSAGVETWATIPLKVTTGRAVAEVSLIQDWGEIGDRIKGSITLKGSPVPAETVRVRLLDRRRRELARKDCSPAETVPFDFEVASWMPGLVTVEAQVLQNGTEVSRAYRYFTVTRRNRGQFNFLMWGCGQGTLAPYVHEALARSGVTVYIGQGFMDSYSWIANPPKTVPEIPRHFSAYNMALIPYSFHVNENKSPEGIKQPYCWNDEEAVKKHAATMAHYNMVNRKIGVFAYSLGDENRTRQCCLSPHCARAYRNYLKESYGDLAALNASWGTTFTNWSEVGISNPTDNEESTSFGAGNFPRWFDRQAFKSYNYVMYCKNLGKGFESIDLQAKVGFEGAGTFGQGDDLDLIVRTLGFWLPYPFTGDEVIPSLPSRSHMAGYGNWMGYQKDADSLLRHYWRMITRGADMVGWWMYDGIGDWHGWLAPDLRPFPAVKDILEDTRFIREGVGDVLIRSQLQDDGVNLLYSFPSTFANRLHGGDAYGGYESCHIKMQKLIRDMGLQYRYVTDRMLRLGEFDPARCRVLVLTRADALGTKEVDVIRRFVEAGGTVIADVRTGMYDNHCKPRQQGILDDLFGIRREGKNQPKKVALTLPGKDGRPIAFGSVLADPSVRTSSSTAVVRASVDGIPLLVQKPAGKGAAILLNFSSFSLPDLGVEGVPAGMGAILETIFADAGIKPAIGVAAPRGQRARGIETTRWKDGDVEILSLYQAYGKKRSITVSLKTPRAVYDLRCGKFLGMVQDFPTAIVPGRAAFFALCPATTARPNLAMEKPAVQRGTLAKGVASVPGAGGLHGLRVRVFTGGKELDWFQKTLVANGTGTTFELPLAFNDPAGTWKIRAIDVLTGLAAETALSVK